MGANIIFAIKLFLLNLKIPDPNKKSAVETALF